MKMPTRNTLALIYSGLIVSGFLVFGIVGILDYFIVKFILFSSFALLAFYLLSILFKDAESE
jgi:hypothetical protein